MAKTKYFSVRSYDGSRVISGLLTEAKANLLVDRLNRLDGGYYNEEEEPGIVDEVMTLDEAIGEVADLLSFIEDNEIEDYIDEEE